MAKFLYNGIELPELPNVVGYKVICYRNPDDGYDGKARLVISTAPLVVGSVATNLYATADGSLIVYEFDGVDYTAGFVRKESLDATFAFGERAISFTISAYFPIWANYDLNRQDSGVLYLAASDPVPVTTIPPITDYDDTCELNLYHNKSDHTTLGKTLTLVNVISGSFRDEVDIINPVIIIYYSKVPDFNYVQIPAFKRYYFVTDVSSVRTGLWEISLHVDVLESYKANIWGTSALIERNETSYDPLIIDSAQPFQQGYDIDIIDGQATIAGSDMSEDSITIMVASNVIGLGDDL